MSDTAVLFAVQNLDPLCGAGAQPAIKKTDLMAVHRDGAAFRDVLPATGAAFTLRVRIDVSVFGKTAVSPFRRLPCAGTVCTNALKSCNVTELKPPLGLTVVRSGSFTR